MMNRFTQRALIVIILISFLPLSLFAQSSGRQAVALVPYWGRNQEVAEEFGEELFDSVDAMEDFRPSPVDMLNLPPDVPEGGFPPYICPSPSLTRGTPYALTGEVFPNEDDPELWDVMMYLWEMEESKLLRADKMSVYDREEIREGYPGMLEWLFSWIPKDLGPQDGGIPRVIWSTPTEPTRWFYFGLRAGGGFTMNSNPRDETLRGNREYVTNNYENINAALHMLISMPNIALISNFGIQLEGVFHMEREPYAEPALSVWASPLLRYTYRWAGNYFSGLGGVYFNFPLNNIENYSYSSIPMGWTAGINLGTKAGPGSLFMDIRFSQDLMDTFYDITMNAYRRNMLTISAGYEFRIATRN